MRKTILCSTIIILLTGCSILKTVKLVKSGTIVQKNYSSSIHFVFDTHINIPVKIKGKTYTFIFDTGAGASAISENLATELGLKPESKSTIMDSQNNQSSLNFYVINSLLIGEVTFLNQPFAGADLSKIDCFGQEFDGIIGSNLARK